MYNNNQISYYMPFNGLHFPLNAEFFIEVFYYFANKINNEFSIFHSIQIKGQFSWTEL